MDAAILDLDGVVTATTKLHAEAWKFVFDEYLERLRVPDEGIAGTAPFDIDGDYVRYVDGKSREEGIRSFLGSRGIVESAGMIQDLGAAKNRAFLGLLRAKGPQVFDDAVRALMRWRRQGIRVALVTSSRNAEAVLEAAGLKDQFDIKVDGNALVEKGLRGKPEPDLFLEAVRALSVPIEEIGLFEDSIAGIQGAKRAGFKTIVGLARNRSAEDLYEAGASLVIHRFDDLPESAWAVEYSSWEPERQNHREAICALGNGVFATRGAFEEARVDPIHYPGTYLAGGYNRLKSELAGKILEIEDFVNWPNWLCLDFRGDGGNWLEWKQPRIKDFRQELDIESGMLSREFVYLDPSGRATRLRSRRIVSIANSRIAAIEWQVAPLNWSGRIHVRSGLDGTVINRGVKRYESLNQRHLRILSQDSFKLNQGEMGICILAESTQSNIRMAQASRTRVYREGRALQPQSRTYFSEGMLWQEFSFEAGRQDGIRVEKVVAIATSRDPAMSEPLIDAQTEVSRAPDFSTLYGEHRSRWFQIWNRTDIKIAGGRSEQLALRLHIFHLLQTLSLETAGRDVGVPARGLHGEAYRGHVFWDELFVFPFLNYRLPELSRELLKYRYRRLKEARCLANKAGFSGAMYPWQSGSTGREESQRIHLNPVSGRWNADHTHLQRHVNSAITYNIWHYFEVTRDLDFMSFFGAEMMLEIARHWISRSVWSPEKLRYEIRGVVGPDEFHTMYPGADRPGIDNNAYTNFMASWSIQKAISVLHAMGEERRAELQERLGLRQEELSRWDDVSRRLFIPIKDGLIHQFEGFDRLDDIDLNAYRAKYGDIQRMDRILEAEGTTTNGFKVVKQADVLMLFYLFSTEELMRVFEYLGYSFESSMIPKNIDYYLRYTAHGSTLSRVVHSWVLARSDRKGSWGLFQEALTSDLADIQGGTTKEGIHLGAMAGTIDIAQRCYTGMEVRDDVLWFNPMLPDELPEASLRVRYRGHWISISVSHEALRIKVKRSWREPARIGFQGSVYFIREGETRHFRLKRRSHAPDHGINLAGSA